MRAGDLVDGRYELAEPLPDRGVGELWRARDARQRGAEVAIAFVALREGGRAPHALRRLPELRHESVLAALRHGAAAGVAYVAYEPFEAPTLASFLMRAWTEGSPPPPKVLERIAERVCDALEAAHALAPPLAHGALSTRSVLVHTAPKVAVRVAGFGLAEGTDVRGDLVAFGAVLRAMFAAPESPGRPPPPPGRDWRRDDLPDALWAVAADACAGSFASAEQLRDALEAAWHDPVTGPAPRPAPPPETAPTEARDDPHAAPTEVTFRRQETLAQEAAAPPPASPASDLTQRSLRPSAPAPAPFAAAPREVTVQLDAAWAPPSEGGAAPEATARSFRTDPPAAVDDATERRRVEPAAAAHRAVAADTVAVAQAGLPAPQATPSTPVDPTRLAVPLPPPATQPATAPGPPPSTGANGAHGPRRTWVVAALFIALFVGVAALVALR